LNIVICSNIKLKKLITNLEQNERFKEEPICESVSPNPTYTAGGITGRTIPTHFFYLQKRHD
jgi:hypothetical protein